jgi:hypothetical protein
METQEATPTKPKRHRSRKFSAEPIVGAIDQNGLGPAMQALNPRMQRFVAELCFGPAGYGSEIRAARAAGYAGNDLTMKTTARRTLHHPGVQAALKEVGYRQIRAASVNAIKNIETIANNLEHRDCLKANLALIDRAGFAVETIHNVKVEHEHRVTLDPEKALANIRELAARVGVQALPPMIEATAEEVEDGDA